MGGKLQTRYEGNYKTWRPISSSMIQVVSIVILNNKSKLLKIEKSLRITKCLLLWMRNRMPSMEWEIEKIKWIRIIAKPRGEPCTIFRSLWGSRAFTLQLKFHFITISGPFGCFWVDFESVTRLIQFVPRQFKIRSWSVRNSFRIRFRSIVGPFLIYSGSALVHSGSILDLFRVQSGSAPGPFRIYFRSILSLVPVSPDPLKLHSASIPLPYQDDYAPILELFWAHSRSIYDPSRINSTFIPCLFRVNSGSIPRPFRVQS